MHIPFITRQKPEASVQLIAQADEQRSLASPEDWMLQLFGAFPAAAGVVVTPQSALRVPAVAAGVKAISEATGILPLHAYQRAEDGSRERNTDHQSFRLLNGDACPWLRGPQLRELMTADAIAYGNGYAVIVRGTENQPRELHRVHPSRVIIEVDSLTSEPTYRLSDGSQTRIIGFRDMLHLRAPSPLSADAVTGKSPLIEARDAISLLIALQAHAAKLFSNGARPSGLLTFTRALTKEAATKMKASWQAMTSTGGTAILDQETKYQALTLTSVDGQFLEIWSLAITEVARILRVPPVLLMDYSRQTWANAETGGQQFLTYSLAPWLSRWEAEVTLKLIAPDDRDTIYVEHLTDALLRADFATRATAYGQYRSMGAMTANEVRAGLNLPPITGGNVLQNPYTTTTTTKTEPAGSKADG